MEDPTMSDLQTHIDNLETHIDALPTDTPTWQSVVDAMGEIFFLLNELKDITVGDINECCYDK